MKKLACIFTLALLSTTMFSCTNDSAEDQTLYEQTTDGTDDPADPRGGN